MSPQGYFLRFISQITHPVIGKEAAMILNKKAINLPGMPAIAPEWIS
jgi:hypothetical protein